MEEQLHEFFAVTISGSLYRVSDVSDPKTLSPIVEKVALKGESKLAVGEKLSGGYLVDITKYGLQLYNTNRHGQTSSLVNTVYHGGKSSPIVALFLKEDEARACFESSDLKEFDERWQSCTKEVIQHIGNDHPVFTSEFDMNLNNKAF